MARSISHLFLSMLLTLLFAPNILIGQQPNIIYIMTDDMGYGDLGAYGQTKYKTPHLDKLASEGIRFTNAYAAAPLCTPTRTGFMTGLYPARNTVGLVEPLTGENADSLIGITPGVTSIATRLKSLGYKTALIGKWHLGALNSHAPNRNGFDYFYGFRSGAADYISHKGAGRKHDLYENDTPIYPQGYLTDLFKEKTVAFINQDHTQPFFLSLMFNAPHWPWQLAGDKPYPDTMNFRRGGSPAIYAQMMKGIDDAVGAVLNELEKKNLTNNTIIIFTNDNGGERYSDNGGLADSKGSLREGGIRVPAFVRWPGKITPGSVTPQPVITMDWTATILAIAGQAKSTNRFQSDGLDLTPILTGQKQDISRTFYWRVTQRAQQKAIRAGDWKYLLDEKGEYLYNIVKDPGEKEDVKLANPDVIQRMKSSYSEWEKAVLPPMPLLH